MWMWTSKLICWPFKYSSKQTSVSYQNAKQVIRVWYNWHCSNIEGYAIQSRDRRNYKSNHHVPKLYILNVILHVFDCKG